MASMIFPDGGRTHDRAEIQRRLGPLGITLRTWPVPTQPDVQALLTNAALEPDEQRTVLDSVDHRLEELRAAHGYSTCDLIVIHEAIPGLAEMLAKFEKIHYHTDDEVRYIVAGRGYFGFVDGSGEQFMVEVSAGDYINVPANTEHWFTLGDSQRIKAVRYFIDKTGWTPVYTERALAFDSDTFTPSRLRGSAA
jgi:1,2-dihydroxy-3-keto-5-methylthiopentene dioxygenase